METCGAIADMDKVTGKLTIYCTTQAPHAHRTLYAIVAGLPEHKIRIISPDIGGGFGNKVGIYPGYVLAVVGSIVTGKPVKWVEDRSENLMSTSFARDYHMHGEIAATRDGKILGLRVNVLADHGAFNNTAQPTKFPAGFFHIFTGSYDYPAAHCTVKGVYTNKAPGGVAYACSFRITEAVYLVERIVDCLADELEMDPAELRMKNLLRAGAVPVHCRRPAGSTTRATTRAPCRWRWTSPATTSCAREQAEKRGARRTDGHRHQLLHRGRRRRPAQAHGHPRARAWPTVRAARPPDRQGSGADIGAVAGSGTRDDLRADRLRRSPASRPTTSRWSTATPTTPRSGWAPTAPARRRSPGAAVAVAAKRVVDKAKIIAAAMLEVSPDDLEWDTGTFSVKGDPTMAKTIQEIALAAHGSLELPEGVEGHLDASVVYDPPNLTYPFGAYICVVDVDRGHRGGARCGGSSPSTTAAPASTR